MEKYIVINEKGYEMCEIRNGDVVTKVENSYADDLYELPSYLHGKGHNAGYTQKDNNYIYLSKNDIEKI